MIVRSATSADADAFPAVERSAGERFRIIPDLAWIADDKDMPADAHRALIVGGSVWAAEDGTGIVGFLSAEVVGQRLHVWQMAVRGDRQGRGVGRALIGAAADWACMRRLTVLTLTTFRDVSWNEGWYGSLGFAPARPGEDDWLDGVLSAEAAQGLPVHRRCAMVRPVVGAFATAPSGIQP